MKKEHTPAEPPFFCYMPRRIEMNFYATCDNDGIQHVHVDDYPEWESPLQALKGCVYGGWWHGQEADYEVAPGTFAIQPGEMVRLAVAPLDGKTCRFCGSQDLSVQEGGLSRRYIYCACCESRGPVGRDVRTAWGLYNGNA